MTALALLGAIWLSGAFVVRMSRGPAPAGGSTAGAAEAFAVGAIGYHVVFVLLGLAGHAMPVWFPVVVTATLAVWWIRRHGRELGPVHPDRLLTPDHLSGLAVVALFVAMTYPALTLPLLDWDPRILWGYKAKVLTVEGVASVDAFLDPYRLHIHPRYPLLVPWLAALVARAQSGFEEIHLRGVVFLFGLLTVWQFHRILRTLAGWKLATLFTVVLVMTGSWISAVGNCSVEVVLSFFSLLVLGRLMAWADGGADVDLVMAGVFLAGAVMTKNEGLLLGVATLMSMALVLGPTSGVKTMGRSVARVALVAVGLSLPWLFQMSRIPAVSDEGYLARLDLSSLRVGVERSGVIATAVLDRMRDFGRWHLVWPLLPVWGLLVLWRPALRDRANMIALSIVTLYAAGILVVYLISPWRDIGAQIGTTFDRITLPVLVMGLAMGARISAGLAGYRRCSEKNSIT